MAAKITGASLQPILRRMNDAPNYHPFEADAFSDWSMNAGDLITINRGEESYTSPVNVSRMVWKGSAPTVQISSTGNKNREPIAKVSRKKYGRGSAGVRSQERFYLEFTSEDGILHSELQMTEASLRTEFVDYGNSLRGEFEMTASHLRTEFEDGVNSLRGSLEMTASRLRTEFNDDVNSLRSDFEITASHLRTEFNDDVNSLRGDFEMTASRLRTEFEDNVNSLRGDFEMTASHLRTEFKDDVNSLRGDFEMTASRLRTEFTDDVNSLRGDLEMTASHLRTEFEDGVNSLRGDFEMTASRLRTEFGDDVNSLRGSLEMTASHLRTEFNDDVNSLRGDFEVTAAGLRGEFESGLSSMRGEFEVTASGLRGEFETATGSLRNEFEVTSSSFGTRISKVVDESGNIKTAQICVAINEDNSSQAVIEADKIHLLGQTIANTVTASYISTKISSISSMLAQNITAQDIDATSVSIRPVAGMGAINVATGYNGSSLSQNGNTYTLRLIKMNGQYDEYSFSLATTLSAGWDGNRKFTVGASPQGVSRYTTLVSAVPQAQQVWNGATGTLSLKATLDDGETTVDVGDITINVSSFLQNKTSTAKFTANGTYTADQGYLGFGEITIDVPQGGTTPVDIGVRFSGSSGSYYAEAFDTVSGNPISGANAVYKLGLSGTKVQVQNSSGTLIGAEYQIPLQAKTGNSKLTSNGTYSPSSGYVGFSSVVVDVPSDLPNAKARFNVASGQYYIEAFDNVSTNPISGSTVNYKLGFSGTKVQIQNNSGTKLRNTPELTLGINTGSLSSGSRTLTVTAGGSNTTATATITDYTSGWNAAVDKVALPVEGSSSQCTFKVPGSTLGSQVSHIYHLANDGNNAVKLYITENNESTTVATLTHNKYTNGYNSAKLTLSNKKITKTSSGSITEYTLALAVDSRNTTAGSDYGKRKVWIKATPNSGDAVEVASTTLTDYRDGWTAAYGKVTVPNTESTSSNYMTVKTPPSDVGGSYTSTNYYVTSDNNYVYLRNGSTAGTIVARGTNNAYGNGWHAYYNTMHYPASGTTATMSVYWPGYTPDSSWDSVQRDYVLSSDNNVCYLKYGNVTMAQLTHNKYTNGYNSARLSLNTSTKVISKSSSGDVTQYTLALAVDSRNTTSGSDYGKRKVWIKATPNSGSAVEVSSTTLSDYRDGWTAAYNKVSIPSSANTSTNYMTVKTPPSTVGGSADETKYYVTSDNSYTYLRKGSTAGTTVARGTNNAYGNGKNDVWNGVSIENTGGTGYETVSGSGATKVVKIPFTTVVSSAGMTNKIKDDNWRQAPTQIWQDAYAEGVTASTGGLTISNAQTYTDSDDSNVHYQVVSGSGYNKNLKHPFKTTVTNSGGTAVVTKEDYWGATPTLIWKKAFEEGFKAALDSTKSYWWYGEETINNVRYWTVWTPKASSYSKVADNHTPVSSEGGRWEAAKYRIPSSTSHSISETHAVASDLASLANNLGASGSSELTDLGTFTAAGGRNYWGIRVSCGGAKKYYYVRAT